MHKFIESQTEESKHLSSISTKKEDRKSFILVKQKMTKQINPRYDVKKNEKKSELVKKSHPISYIEELQSIKFKTYSEQIKFLMMPISKEAGMIQCILRRYRKGFSGSLYPKYVLALEVTILYRRILFNYC